LHYILGMAIKQNHRIQTLSIIQAKYLEGVWKPGKDHWQGVERVLCYIQRTLKYGLMFSADGGNPISTGYSDWGDDASTWRSTTGYVFQIQGNTVSWCSKRQACVSRSTTEAEYIALSIACQEAVCWRTLLSDIQMKQCDWTVKEP
jgi:hypothetical protein